jgi:hypothetical protein
VRVLLDENLPVDLAAELVGHQVTTVSGLGWQGIKNGELLQRAQGTFEVLVTMDRNLEFQQNVSPLNLCVALALAPSNRMVDLRPIVSAILQAIETGRSGELLRVGG